MKKTDIIRGFKLELKSLEEAKKISNMDYHHGKMDQIKSLIRDFQHPLHIQKYKGLLKRLPSRELKLVE